MSRQTKVKSTPAAYSPRLGEGVLVDVEQQLIPGADGTTVGALGISLQNAPVPDRHYVADVGAVIYRNESVKLVFAQETLVGGLRSMVVIHLPTLAAGQFLETLNDMASPSLNEIAELCEVSAMPLLDVKAEPEQTIAAAANLAGAAVTGRDATLDFYHLSAYTMLGLQSGLLRKLPVEPVVRINLKTSLLMSIRDAIAELQKQFPKF